MTLCWCLIAQSSVRVDKGHGVPGRTMAEWLVDAGFDAARVRDSSTSAAQRDEPVTASERPSRRQNVHSGMGRPHHRCASLSKTDGSAVCGPTHICNRAGILF